MTSEHNLEENEGIHTSQPPRAVSHREWENRSLCEQVAGTVSREKASFCCDKEAGRRL